MNLFNFLTAYWRVYADSGFYWWQVGLFCLLITAIIMIIRPPVTKTKYLHWVLGAWLLIAALVWTVTMIVALGGPPVMLVCAWGFIAYCKPPLTASFFRRSGVANDDA
jgi:hypothetical protein